MDIQEHTIKVQERLKMIGSEKASVSLEDGNVIYTDWNNSLWVPVPQEDITIKG